MTALIYDTLLIIMMLVLYRAGTSVKRNGRILSPAGISAIVVYTLNEGLRFGRGIDYNLYGITYERLERGAETNWDFSFQLIAEMLVEIGIPWQGYVILMSGTFIVATIILLKVYREGMQFALPLFVFYSMSATENMVRWYMAFSFVMIGLSFLLKESSKKGSISFLLLSILACTFHFAMAPIPIIFYLLTYRKSPLLSPLPVLVLYFGLAFFFHTDFMLQFVDLFNTLSAYHERFEGYGNKAEYWLTGGYSGRTEISSLPSILEILFICTTVICGYRAIKNMGYKYIFAYNLFIIGVLLNPLSRQIELLDRYDSVFLFFRAIVIVCIIENVLILKQVKIGGGIVILFIISFLNTGRRALSAPFENPDCYLYVWNNHTYTYEIMVNKRRSDAEELDSKKRKERKFNY